MGRLLGVWGVCVAVAGLVFSGCSAPEEALSPGEVKVANARELADYFDSIGFRFSGGDDPIPVVPRVRFTQVPKDWVEERSVGLRKSVFFRAMTSAVLQVNEEVGVLRRRLLAVGPTPNNEGDRSWLAELAGRYGVTDGERLPSPEEFEELVDRVDGVPASLAVAQAAVESGWGRSRFAQEGNALFGQWTTSARGIKAEGSDARLASFETPHDSVESYLHNLNTHRAYRWFRTARARMRRAGDPLDGYVLAQYLRSYAEDGVSYVSTLRTIIRADGLSRLDTARLAEGAVTRIRPVYGEGGSG